MKMISGLSSLFSLYDLFIFDLWGVIHNGFQAFPKALNALENLKKNSQLHPLNADLKKIFTKKTFILSNAPRRSDHAIDRLLTLGMPKDLYDGIYTSGTSCYHALRDRIDPFYQCLGKKFFTMGPKADWNLLDGLDYSHVDRIEEADFILLVGTTNKDFDASLVQYGLRNQMPLVCANADHVVIFNETPKLCAGALADVYEKEGGIVGWHGKPLFSMYETVHKMAGHHISKERILMVGDSLRTDIKGANNYGIDSALVLDTGIHKDDRMTSKESALRRFEEYQACPTYLLKEVSW